MTTFYPLKNTPHEWSSSVVGGADLEPIIAKLTGDEKLGLDSAFEKQGVDWSGAVDVVDVGNEAYEGSYVQNLDYSGSYIFRNFTDTAGQPFYVLTGAVRFPYNSTDDPDAEIVVVDNLDSKTFTLTIHGDETSVGNQWIPFYVIIDNEASSPDLSIQIKFRVVNNGASTTEATCWLDGIRLYGASELVELDSPCNLSISWQRVMDAEYEMSDGTKKTYVQGFRPNLKMRYGICTAAEFAKHVGLSEAEELFIAPNTDSLWGIHCRWDSDFDYKYFRNKMFAHENTLSFDGIFLYKYKNREYGNSYYSATTV